METVAVIGVLGLVLTFSTSIVMIAFRVGSMSARLDELEKWRKDIRADMHEISDQLIAVGKELHGLSVLIVERTDRRIIPRPLNEKE